MKNQKTQNVLKQIPDSASIHPQCQVWSHEVVPYEQGICSLFEFIEDCMLGQSSKIIRPALYWGRCQWHHLLATVNGGLFCSAITQDQLDSVKNIFLLRIRTGSLGENNTSNTSLSQYSSLLTFQPQFQNITNPYQALQKCKESLAPQFLEAAAELMTLSLTKIQFSKYEPVPLARGCVAAIEQHKNLKSQTGSLQNIKEAQIEEIKQLYIKLLLQIDKIQIPQFQY